MEYAREPRDLGTGRPTSAFLKAMQDLHQSLAASPTPCDRCESGLARHVQMFRGTTVNDRVKVLCETCWQSWRAAKGPIERRQWLGNLKRGTRR